MKISVQDLQGNPTGDLEVQFEVIESGKGTQAVHDAVVALRAGARSGNHATKRVGEVAGSNKKPWRQKGTGRARAGSVRSPLWRGGGVTHGPQPRDYSKKINKKVSRLALRKALSERLRSGDIVVVDRLEVSEPKTKTFLKLVEGLNITGVSTLFVVVDADNNFQLASRNIPGVAWSTGQSINTYEVLQYDKLVFTKDAFAEVEARLTREKGAK